MFGFDPQNGSAVGPVTGFDGLTPVLKNGIDVQLIIDNLLSLKNGHESVAVVQVIRQSEVTAVDTMFGVTPKASYVDQLALGVVLALSCLVDVHRCSDRQAAHNSENNTKEDRGVGIQDGVLHELQE